MANQIPSGIESRVNKPSTRNNRARKPRAPSHRGQMKFRLDTNVQLDHYLHVQEDQPHAAQMEVRENRFDVAHDSPGGTASSLQLPASTNSVAFQELVDELSRLRNGLLSAECKLDLISTEYARARTFALNRDNQTFQNSNVSNTFELNDSSLLVAAAGAGESDAILHDRWSEPYKQWAPDSGTQPCTDPAADLRCTPNMHEDYASGMLQRSGISSPQSTPAQWDSGVCSLHIYEEEDGESWITAHVQPLGDNVYTLGDAIFTPSGYDSMTTQPIPQYCQALQEIEWPVPATQPLSTVLFLQPETNPVTQEQLINEVKGIYSWLSLE